MNVSVLMFCPQFAPLTGGAEKQAAKLSKELVRQGARVTVLTPKLTAHSPLYQEDEGVAIRRFSVFDLNRRFPAVPGLGPLNLIGLAAQTRHAALEAIKSCNVVHAHGISALTAFVLGASRKLNKPFLCKLASSGTGFDLSKLAGIGFGGIYLANYMRDRVTAWIATTGAVAVSLAGAGIEANRIVHIPNGVDLPSPEKPRDCRKVLRRFLYLGRISRACDRDFDTMLDAFFALAAEYDDAELALVGDGDLSGQIRARASSSPCAARVLMPGPVEDPAGWFAWADFLLLPSRREGMSNALIEAMAAGIVPIVNDIPANREVLDDGRAGCLTPVGDATALALRMKRLIDGHDEYERLQERAFAHCRKYSIVSVAQQYLAIYRQLQASPNNGRTRSL
ncbi:MAG: glycosyltransferase family 4 protein [Rhodomicrobium sp.]